MALLMRDHGRSPWWGLLVVLFPGVLAVLFWYGPEALGTALVLFGFRGWRRGQIHVAVVAFVAASLMRETFLIVPAVLAIEALVTGRRLSREAVWLALTAVPLFAWLVVVRLRLGAWPWDAGNGRLALPFTGLVERAPEWTSMDLLAMSALIGGSLIAWRRCPSVRSMVLGHAVFASLLGSLVWVRWLDYGRVLVPAFAFALLGVVSNERRTVAMTPDDVHREPVASTTMTAHQRPVVARVTLALGPMTSTWRNAKKTS
jgi:hypothetical protein